MTTVIIVIRLNIAFGRSRVETAKWLVQVFHLHFKTHHCIKLIIKLLKFLN